MSKLKSFSEFAGFKEVDALGYGNEAKKHRLTYSKEKPVIIKMTKENGVYEQLLHFQNPRNSSQETLSEIEENISLQKELSDSEIEFIKRAETDMLLLINERLIELGGTDEMLLLQAVTAFTDPLLYKLKHFYNRPRPAQLARALDLELYPVIPTNASSAAYPSGHALDSYTCGWIIGQKYPELADQISTFCEEVAFTRIQAGVHYRSDADFSKIIFDKLVESQTITLDYFLL
jgi:hypothetical protein